MENGVGNMNILRESLSSTDESDLREHTLPSEQREKFLETLADATSEISKWKKTRPEESNSDERADGVNKVIAFLRDKRKEISAVLLDSQDAETAFALLIECFAYNAGMYLWLDVEKSSMVTDMLLRDDIGSELAKFLREETENVSEFLSKSIEKNEDGSPLFDSKFYLHLNYFLSSYLKLANHPGSDKREEDILSFMHALLPLSKKFDAEFQVNKNSVEPEHESRAAINRRHVLNKAAVLFGNETAINACADEFMKSEDIWKLNFFIGTLHCLFPDRDTGRSTYSEPHLAQVIHESEQSYLRNGYSPEEIHAAKKILTLSSGDRVLEEIIGGRFELPAREYIYAWRKSRFFDSLYGNLGTMKKIQSKNPKALRELSFDGPGHILCYGRYDVDFLLEQLVPLQEQEPYGVICNAYQDHNGAFYNKNDMHEKIRRGANDVGIKTRLIEYDETAPSKYRLYEQLSRIASPTRPAEFIWINQHGNSVAENEMNIQHNWENIFGVGNDRSSLVLKPGGSVLCFMCFGGEKNNVMHALTQQYDNIIAAGPTGAPANVDDVDFIRTDDKLSIKVRYIFPQGSNTLNESHDTAYYSAGK